MEGQAVFITNDSLQELVQSHHILFMEHHTGIHSSIISEYPLKTWLAYPLAVSEVVDLQVGTAGQTWDAHNSLQAPRSTGGDAERKQSLLLPL